MQRYLHRRILQFFLSISHFWAVVVLTAYEDIDVCSFFLNKWDWTCELSPSDESSFITLDGGCRSSASVGLGETGAENVAEELSFLALL